MTVLLSAVLLSIAVGPSEIDRLLASPALKGTLTGVCVADMDGKVLFERLGESRLVPASNQKILTAIYALSQLEPEFRPVTRFWREPGKFFVDAPGDPSLQKAQLLGVRGRFGLTGDAAIYVRQAYRPGVPPSWEYDDLPNRYAPRITALSFDRGGFEVWSRNGAVEPLDDEYRIAVRPVRGATNGNTYFPEKRLVVVHGPASDGDRMIEAFAVPDPDVVAARFLGGTIVHTDTVPSRPHDFEIIGPPLLEMVKFCLEKSDNCYAEHLLMMAAAKDRPLGDKPYKTAAERLTKFLETQVGVEPGSVIPLDGSGMSRHNMVTPRAVCQILAWANSQAWRQTFFEALATSGEGTLASRLKSSKFLGKTGTLNAVVCLSGFVETASGRRLAISMLFNNTNNSAAEVRAIQDKVVSLIEREVF